MRTEVQAYRLPIMPNMEGLMGSTDAESIQNAIDLAKKQG